MRRREFISLLGGAAAAWPLAARAQQRPAMPVIGYLDSLPTIVSDPTMAAFRQGLSEAGFVEGRNVTVEYRSADGRYERLPALAADLVQRQVAVIAAANGGVVAHAAKAATATIPIVFFYGGDPVRDVLVASFGRPGGNVTGIGLLVNVLVAKRLELFRELVPNAAVMGVLVNPNNANAETDLNEAQLAARALGLQLTVFRASSVREIDQAFEDLVAQRLTALLISADAFLSVQSRDQIAALGERHRVATSFSNPVGVRAGGLMSYSDDRLASWRQFGGYVGRVLKGEKPADLPVLQPTRFQFVLNLKTAKTLNLDIPLKLHAFADEVIE